MNAHQSMEEVTARDRRATARHVDRIIRTASLLRELAWGCARVEKYCDESLECLREVIENLRTYKHLI